MTRVRRIVAKWLAPARFARELVNPSRRARAIPLGRLAIAALFVFVAIFIVFTLRSMGVQLPFVSHPYRIQAEFLDAAGLDPSNGPQVSVAGVPEGQVTAVHYKAGRAVVSIDLSSEAKGKVFRDASVRVRPFNGANFLEVDVSPGNPATGSLPDGGVIDSSRSSVPVATDQVLGVLDADTRAYLQILTSEAATAVHGTGGELAFALHKLAPLSNDARQIGAMLRQRRQLITQLVGESNTIFSTLARRRGELASTVAAGSRVLSVSAARTKELALATRQLPSVLTLGESTSNEIAGVAPQLEVALERFAPAARAFASGLSATRSAIPALQELLRSAVSLTTGTLRPSLQLLALASKLGEGIGAAVTGYAQLADLIHTMVAHGPAITHFSDAISGVVSTQDTYGVLGRVRIVGISAPTAEDFGLSAAAASKPAADGSRSAKPHSTLQVMLATALSDYCRRGNPLACAAALMTPGLPRPAALLQSQPAGSR
jgi:virulence factor Mce-like protein